MASAMIERAEFPVQRNRTFNVRAGMSDIVTSCIAAAIQIRGSAVAGKDKSSLCEFTRAVRPDRAAAMLVRIDERCERERAFKCRVQPKAKFPEERKVRPEARGDNQLV